MIRFILGVILMMGGVGGIEFATSTWDLWMSFLVSVVGVVTMIWPLADGSIERQANNG